MRSLEVKPSRPWSFFFYRKIMHAWHYYKRIKCLRGYLQCYVVQSQYCCFQLLSELFRAEFQWHTRETDNKANDSIYCCLAKQRLILVLQPTSQELKTFLLWLIKTCCGNIFKTKLGTCSGKTVLLSKVIGNHPWLNNVFSEVKQISFRLMAIKVFECLQFFYESLILVLKDSDSVF